MITTGILSQDLAEVAAGRQFGLGIASCVEAMVREGTLDPMSYRIITALPRSAQGVSTLLAWSHCRWSELRSVDLPALIHRAPLRIRGTKGSADRIVQPRPAGDAVLWATVPHNAPLCTISYDTVCANIRLASRRLGLPDLAGCQRSTHLFRHCWASWQAALGTDLSDISAGLGHHQSESTAHYIHPELVDLALSL